MDPSDLLEHYQNHKKNDIYDEFVDGKLNMSEFFEKVDE